MQSLLTKKVEEARDLLGKKDLIVERQKYDAKDSKVHDNLVNIKESILKKENEMFGIKNTIEILNKKVNSAVLKLNEKEEEFISVRKTHDDNENILNKQNRLENEKKINRK